MILPSSGRRKVDVFIAEIVDSNPDIVSQYNCCPKDIVDELRKSYNRIQYKKKQRLKNRKK